jgi:hypothetical protein
MIVRCAALLVLLALPGCLSWQGSYDSLARRECQQIVDQDDRRACLNRVEENASRRRAEKRAG